jgi:hypothetical protein
MDQPKKHVVSGCDQPHRIQEAHGEPIEAFTCRSQIFRGQRCP